MQQNKEQLLLICFIIIAKYTCTNVELAWLDSVTCLVLCFSLVLFPFLFFLETDVNFHCEVCI